MAHTERTAEETLAYLQDQNPGPGRRWAISRNRSAIGVWAPSLGRYYTVAACTICTPKMWVINPGECLVNGQQVDYGWEPVSEPAKTPGQLAYEADLQRQPNYDDGSARPTWEELAALYSPSAADAIRQSWEKNPTPR